MALQGQAGYDLQAFDKSADMSEIRGMLTAAANKGNFSLEIPYDSFSDGSTRNSLMAITLLRSHGYECSLTDVGILVKW